MTFLSVPIKACPAQTLDVVLNGQNVSIALQTRLDRLYMDVAVDNRAVVRGRVCRDRMPIVNEAFRHFVGELFFIDKMGKDDPRFDLISERFVLIYWDGQ